MAAKMEKMAAKPEEMKKIELKTPKGTRDFDPEQMAVREKVLEIITNVFKRHGAVTIDTPVFELKEILTGKYGDEGAKLIYDLADQGGEICSLRYDLTVPFARYLAANKIERMKRYHIAKVYRRDQPVMTKGRYREFYQCDFDIAGSGEMMIQEAECLKVVDEVLSELNIGDFEIRLNHRLLLEGMFAESGIATNSFKSACASVDKLDKQPWAEVREELIKEKGLDEKSIDKLGQFVQLRDNNKEWTNNDLIEYFIKKYSPECPNSPGATQISKAIEDLKTLIEYSGLFGFSPRLVFYPSLARGLDYYTGVIYEVVMKDFSFTPRKKTPPPPQMNHMKNSDEIKTDSIENDYDSTGNLGSVAAGGRYDNLVGMFVSSAHGGKGKAAGTNIPCVGVSFGIERLFTIMELKSRSSSLTENNVAGVRVTPTDVFVASVKQRGGVPDALLKERMRICTMLWDANIRAEMSYKQNPKLLDQFQYCEKNLVPWVVLFGDEELAKKSVKIRNVVSREENLITIEELVPTLKGKIQQRKNLPNI